MAKVSQGQRKKPVVSVEGTQPPGQSLCKKILMQEKYSSVAVTTVRAHTWRRHVAPCCKYLGLFSCVYTEASVVGSILKCSPWIPPQAAWLVSTGVLLLQSPWHWGFRSMLPCIVFMWVLGIQDCTAGTSWLSQLTNPCLLSETRTLSLVLPGLEFRAILLPQSPKSWKYQLASVVIETLFPLVLQGPSEAV